MRPRRRLRRVRHIRHRNRTRVRQSRAPPSSRWHSTKAHRSLSLSRQAHPKLRPSRAKDGRVQLSEVWIHRGVTGPRTLPCDSVCEGGTSQTHTRTTNAIALVPESLARKSREAFVARLPRLYTQLPTPSNQQSADLQNSGQRRLGYARMRGVFILHPKELLAATFHDSTGFRFGLPTGDETNPCVSQVRRGPESELQASFDQPILDIEVMPCPRSKF